MIKRIVYAVSMLALVVASSTFASNQVAHKGYYTSPVSQIINKALIPPTNITISNYSEDVIYSVVPGTQIDTFLYSGQSSVITHDTHWGNTRIQLTDPRRYVFFDQFVCHRAVLKVEGRPGYYRTKVDASSC